jgi:hypothetical protein
MIEMPFMAGAVVLALLALPAIITAWKFRRFTLMIARSVTDHDYRIPASQFQDLMTPAWLRMIMYAGYGLAMLSAALGISAIGWWWVAVVAVLVLFLPGPLLPVWPYPAASQIHAWARRQLGHSMGSSSKESERLRSEVAIQLLRYDPSRSRFF